MNLDLISGALVNAALFVGAKTFGSVAIMQKNYISSMKLVFLYVGKCMLDVTGALVLGR